MPEFINPNSYTVHLVGQDGKAIHIRSKQKMVLPEYFNRYVERGFINIFNQPVQNRTKPHDKVKPSDSIIPKMSRQSINNAAANKNKAVENVPNRNKVLRPQKIFKSLQNSENKRNIRKIVGKKLIIDPMSILRSNLDNGYFPISNNIGVGILSYNRYKSLKRLIDSIIKHTELKSTTIFISDDCSDDTDTINYLSELEKSGHFVIIRNDVNLGVAGNSNRLLKCLSRFKDCLLLNDDVEIISDGWEYFYKHASSVTDIKHFQHRQPGVYGAAKGVLVDKGVCHVRKVDDKPQGAILSFTNDVVDVCGYFNEQFGKYGMEHVDWSKKPAEFGLQDDGFFDVEGSDEYFIVHNEESGIDSKSEMLIRARKIFNERQVRLRCEPSDNVKLPAVSYVVPFKNTGRTDSIVTVINNLRAQRYPVIDMILVENDSSNNFDVSLTAPVRYYHTAAHNNLFNKSKAFNVGVHNSKYSKLILHDADMLVLGNYTKSICDTLDNYEACHLGGTVIYTTEKSMHDINSKKFVNSDIECDRAVGYYEGGSLACLKEAYWRVGGFNEDFNGYGCFLPGNKVLTNRGLVNIENVKACDELLTHTGSYQKQEARIRNYSGSVFDIFVPGRLPIKGVTPQHPFLVHDVNGEYVWREVRDLKKGDLLAQTDVMPDLSPTMRFDDVLNTDKSNNRFDIGSNINDLSYIIGLYLAEGVIQSPDRLRTTYLFLHEAEKFLAENVSGIINRLNPNIKVNYEYVKRNCRHVVISNSFIAKLIYSVCGKHRSINKIISPQFLNSLTNEALANLLGGMTDGDAGHQFNSEKRLVYHTSSINLAFAASGMMRKLGVAHSFGKRKGGGFENSQKWSYDLTVNREYEHLINSLYHKPEYYGSNSTGKSQFGLIYDIREYHYDGLVYNFEVDNDHSYYVHGIAVHNCEDCDFFVRLSNGSKWTEDRTFDLLHLWHSRVDGWNHHHNVNKQLEIKLNRMSIGDRIAMQVSKLRELKYI